MTKYVIIGNSTAAIAAVEGIRRTERAKGGGRQGTIVIISDEPHHSYSRPLISYLLLGKVTTEGMKYRGDDFYDDNNCVVIYRKATEIDNIAKQVGLDDGRRIPYDKLLVATGSSPFVPPMAGLDMVKQKTTFMSMDDARRLEAMLAPDKKVLIVGAGLIGLKCAEGIMARVTNVTVLDLAPRILSSILDEDGARLVQGHLEKKGVRFHLAASIERFEDGRAYLTGGDVLDFDILVLAVGVRPNTGLLQGTADIDRGVMINEKSETSTPGIYAAGDCAQGLDVSSGEKKIVALLPGAYMQGECAGINMAGGAARFDKGIPMNAIGFFGLHVVTAGTYSGEVYATEAGGEVADGTDLTYKRLFYDDNRLLGFIMIGDVEKAGIYTALIRERTPLDSIDFALVCQKPGLMAFTKEDRRVKLGGRLT